MCVAFFFREIHLLVRAVAVPITSSDNIVSSPLFQLSAQGFASLGGSVFKVRREHGELFTHAMCASHHQSFSVWCERRTLHLNSPSFGFRSSPCPSAPILEQKRCLQQRLSTQSAGAAADAWKCREVYQHHSRLCCRICTVGIIHVPYK